MNTSELKSLSQIIPEEPCELFPLTDVKSTSSHALYRNFYHVAEREINLEDDKKA